MTLCKLFNNFLISKVLQLTTISTLQAKSMPPYRTSMICVSPSKSTHFQKSPKKVNNRGNNQAYNLPKSLQITKNLNRSDFYLKSMLPRLSANHTQVYLLMYYFLRSMKVRNFQAGKSPGMIANSNFKRSEIYHLPVSCF